MSETKMQLGFSPIRSLSELVGTSEPALTLLLTILAGYPLAYIHRKYLHGRAASIQHMYFIVTGFGLGYLNYAFDFLHSLLAIFVSYLAMCVFGPTEICVGVTFFFNMIYLLLGYYFCGTNDYDINWTMPQCVLVLRLISCGFDYYDGNQKEETLSQKSKEIGLKAKPGLLEYFGYTLFPTSFLVGPQFPLKRYQDFINAEFCDNESSVGCLINSDVAVNSEFKKYLPPRSSDYAFKRFGLGVMYLVVSQAIGIYMSDEYLISKEFGELSFLTRCFWIGVWGRITLYRYISCWLLAEGACIWFGLSYNGMDENKRVKWDGLGNVDIVRLETATEFNHYIQSFNCNTNLWVAQYIYKRLKFLGNRFISQAAALLFLAIWHGFHTGYYICFFFEFMVMYMEKDWQSILKKYPDFANFFSKGLAPIVSRVLLHVYTFVFMGWCLMPFTLLTFERYWLAYSNASFIGVALFLLWPILYAPVLRTVLKSKTRSHTQ